MKDEFQIKLDVAGRLYPVTIKRGDEQDEFLFRKASKRVQQYVLEYRQYFAKSIEDRDILALIAIQLAREVVLLEGKNNTEPFTQKIRQLTKQMEDYLQYK
ncbi:MAG: cell division protein ZapA [Tannerella sp.]|jgi:cell division protein ZapA|nr:cell division protein ZapA [Tannerella sp.]